MAGNKRVNRARRNKNDEFYTRLVDIESELKHYRKHLKGKHVFMNCDDPEESNFWKYFQSNFDFLGLKKITSTHYHDKKTTYRLDYDGEKIVKVPLKQNGDFRSGEVVEILKESDVVVTNPPFSLFRDYIAQLVEYEKDFLVIGNINALTYKETFPLIKNNDVWLGYNSARRFLQPDGSLYETARTYWYTNLDTRKRHDDIILYKKYSPEEYPNYDNYNAINVDKTNEIPMDYDGYMGVPITFMDKYNPNQFEIFGFMNTGEENKGIRYPDTPHGRPIVNGTEKYVRILIKKRVGSLEPI